MKKIKYMLMIAALLITAQMASAALITDVVGSSGTAKTQHGGILTNGSLNLTNRTHVYKQVPEFLLDKAEYVKTSNDDRETNPFTVTFKLTVDADVYLFLDLRIGGGSYGTDPTAPGYPTNPDLTTKMNWVLTNGFVDTGIDMDVDEGNDGSINSRARLYKKAFGAGTTVTLYEQNDGTNRNMYGFGAIANEPLAKNPVPADGQGLATDPSSSLYPGVKIDGILSWEAPSSDKIDPAVPVQYRVFMDPNEAKVIAGVDCEYWHNYNIATSYDPHSNLAYTKTYYWKVDTSVTFTGETDPNLYSGTVWKFKTAAQDNAPIAQAGQSIRTWLAKAQSNTVQLQGSVLLAEDDSTAQWTAYKAAFPGSVPPTEVVFADATSPTTTVTISATGEYVLQLTATDNDAIPGSPSVSQMKVIVYDTPCQAAQNTAGYVKNPYDFDDNCVVNLNDFALFAKKWLNSTAATDSIFYEATVTEPTAEALVSEYWLNLPDGTDPNLLLADPRYPVSPTGSDLLTGQFKFTGLNKDHYGQRTRGYIVAPATGDYTFYITSDDNSRLFLSTDTDPANAVMIAYTGYTGETDWEANTTQVSPVQNLTAGEYYYVEVIFMENTGADRFSVGWKKPGETTIEVVPGSALRWYLQP